MTASARHRWAIPLGFTTVYLVWGSTYLGIRYAIASIPPFLMLGTRFLVAGSVLYLWARLRGAPRPSAREWRTAFVLGALMLVAGTGAVVWAEQTVPSGLTALLVALVPAWTVLVEWVLPGGRRPGWLTSAGLLAGLAGTTLLATPGAVTGGATLLATGILALGSLTWAIGSVYQHHGAPRPTSAPMSTAIQMLGGGVILVAMWAVLPAPQRFEPAAVTLRSALALLYLITFGSLLAYSCYVWLLQVSTPAKVATYAYVNPVVALLLGWAVAGEPLTARTAAASVVIVAAVAVITWAQAREHAA